MVSDPRTDSQAKAPLVPPALQPALPPADEMWDAFRRRDSSYVGIFWICVRTTGIYCRVGCPARLPKRENVDFVASSIDAQRLGYRPCKRCQPELAAAPGDARLGPEPGWARALRLEVEAQPFRRVGDSDLRARGIEPARARRWFKARFGVSFHGYQRALRLGAALQSLRSGEAISHCAFDAGFESESGFRDAWQRVFGRPPSQVRAASSTLVTTRFMTPLGAMIAIVATSRDGEGQGDGIVLCDFLDRRGLEAQLSVVRKRHGTAIVPGRHPLLEALERELGEYFEGRREVFGLPLAPIATPFEERVWTALRDLPYGTTTSYGALAEHLGRTGASRAVGRANGANRIAILIPCHRVVGADGRLTGYGGGLWRKQRLLELEARPRGLPLDGRAEA